MESGRTYDTVTIEFAGAGGRSAVSFRIADDWETLRDLTLAAPKVREAVLAALSGGDLNAVRIWYTTFIDTALGEGAAAQIVADADEQAALLMLGPVVEYLCERVTERWKNAFAE